jgi:hypothetical protein
MMALAKQMMGGGLSAEAAKAINGSVAIGLTAAGTSQSDALALDAAFNLLATVGSGAGARLPSVEVSDSVEIYNSGANALTIYPDSGSQINSLSTNGGVQLATNTAIKFRRVTSTRWIGYLSS